jgi:hypothetical protein
VVRVVEFVAVITIMNQPLLASRLDCYPSANLDTLCIDPAVVF